MTTVIKLKRGTTTPTTSDLANGEVAIDTSAKKFYVNDNGTIREIGGVTDGADIETEQSYFSNYNTISSDWSFTPPTNRNSFLKGPITVDDGVTFTINGNGYFAII